MIDFADSNSIRSKAKEKQFSWANNGRPLRSSLRKNKFSTISAVKGGKEMTFNETSCQLLDPSGTALLQRYVDGKMDLINLPECAMRSRASKEGIQTLYRRLGHRNYPDIRKLISTGIVRGIDNLNDNKDYCCIPCIKGK